MSKKYRPSNGTEGMSFMEDFCFRCKRETWSDDNPDGIKCDILTRTYLHKTDEPEYPEEWQEDENFFGRCTAFEPEAKP